jgi:SAM-dependent methyltransferase
MLAAFDPAATLLNVPCGAGRFVETIAPESRRRVVFADNSQPMLDAARTTLAGLGAQRIELRLEDVTRAKPSEQFDVVVCVRLLHHLEGADFEAALDYVVSAAQHGIVCTFASSSTWKGWRRLRRKRAGGSGETLRSDQAMRDALAARGWRVARSRRVSFFFSTQTWLLLVRAER